MGNIIPYYGNAASALTVTHLDSLASDGNLLAGWNSGLIDNTSNLSVEDQIAGTIETGTSPSAATILIYLWACLDDTPTYPDAITSSEGAVTLTSANVKNSGNFKLAQTINVDTNSNRKYPFIISVANAFGGHLPKRYGIFVVHNTGVALAASGQEVTRIPVQYQEGIVQVSPTDHSSTITAGGTAQIAIASNSARKAFLVMNPPTATENLSVMIGASTNGAISLNPGGSFSSDAIAWTGAIYVNAATTGHAYTAYEGT